MSIIQGGSMIEALQSAGVVMQPESRLIVVDPNDIANFSLQDAIDEAVAGQGDVIGTLPGGINVAAQVNMNKAGVRLMSLSLDTRNRIVNGEYHAIFSTTVVDAPVMKITAPCVIEGIGFAGSDAGALFFSGASLLIGGDADANPFGVQIKGCRFPKWGLAARIGIAVEGSSDVTVEECGFEGVGTALAIGVYVQGACQNITVRNNVFRQVTAAISHGAFAGGGPHAMYHGNMVEDGIIFDSNGNTATGFIFDNWSELAPGSSYDDTIDNIKGFGMQISGNHYVEST